jgi:hypothetical protein
MHKPIITAVGCGAVLTAASIATYRGAAFFYLTRNS